MANFRFPNASQVVMFLLIGVVVLIALTSFLNFSSFGSDRCMGADNSNCKGLTENSCNVNTQCTWGTPDIIKEDRCYGPGTCGAKSENACISDSTCKWGVEGIAPKIFSWLIVAVAVWIVFFFATNYLQGRVDRRMLVWLVILAIILYYVYTKFLVPQLGLPSLGQAAFQLQGIVSP